MQQNQSRMHYSTFLILDKRDCVCEICGYAFHSKSHLARHIKVIHESKFLLPSQ